MRQELVQSLRLEQKFTQQLMLVVTVLQASALDLDQMVMQELEQNPALEMADDRQEPGFDERPQTAAADVPETPAIGDVTPDQARPEPEIIATRPGEEYSISELMPDEGFIPTAVYRGGGDEETSAVELAAGPGLHVAEVMMPHLRATLSPEDAAVAEYILESLDEDGFRSMSPEEIAEQTGAPLERVLTLLHVIQRMEPGGIGCKDVRESFLVQLELAGFDPLSLERRLLTDFWELVMKKQTSRVAKLCGVTEDDIRDAIRRIVALESRPARQFAAGAPEYVEPDFSVEWRGDELVAIPSDTNFPRLRLSRRYQEILIAPKSFPKEQVAFAREKWQKAQLFLKAIESRRRTLKRLVELIIDDQREFFLHGTAHLKPATLREAADVLKVHPSTASRAIAGKYLETTYGIFPFSYFFKAGAGDKSRTSIKERIQTIIDAEDRADPLSDDAICDILKAEGTTISRRTVAKYRGELRIAGCGDRKCF